MNLSLMQDKNTDSLVKRKLFDAFAKQRYFNQPFLNPSDPHCTPQDYLEACTEKVPLQELYKFVTSPYHNEGMNFHPALFEIVAPRIQKRFKDCKYVITVFNKKQKKVFMEGVSELFKYWNICYEYLIIMTEDKDAENNLTGTFTLKVHDFLRDAKWFKLANIKIDDKIKHVVFYNDILYMCSDTKFYVAAVENMIAHEKVVEFADLKLKTVDPQLKIHCFVLFNLKNVDQQMIVVMENADHQIDFSRLKVENTGGSEEEFKHHFIQHRQINPSQNYIDDPIERHVYVITDYHYGVSIRKSGRIELYWNMNIVEVVENEYVQDVLMSMAAFYFKMHDGRILKLDHNNSEAYRFTNAYEVAEDEFDENKIIVKRIQNFVKLFTNFAFNTIDGNSGALVCHLDFISLYDLSTKTWINHIEWEVDVYHMFKIIKQKDGGASISALCKNGAVYYGVLDYKKFEGHVAVKWRDQKIDEEIVRTCDDVENQTCLFITVKEGEKYRLKYLFRMKVFDFEHISATTNENLQVVTVQDRCTDSFYFILDGKTLYLFMVKVTDEVASFTQLKKLENINITGTLHSASSDDTKNYATLFDEKNLYFFNFKNASPLKIYEDVNAVSMQNFTEHANFIICQEKTGTKPIKGGLKAFSNYVLLQKQKFVPIEIANIGVGALGQFEYASANQRMGVIQSLDSLIIMPILHRTCMKFINCQDLEKYVCVREIQDKFMALDFTGKLCTWSVPTGKLLRTHQLENSDFDKYEVKSKYKFGPVLIVSKAELDISQERFFEPYQLIKSTPNQTPFMINLKKSIKRWKCIEIKNETELEVHCEYVHPSYEKEWIFISEDKTRLVEIGLNYRTFFYKSVPDTETLTDGQINPNLIKWQLIRQINDYPSKLENDAGRLEFFSPDFSRYIIYNEKENQFSIKDSYTDQVRYLVPKELMSVKQNRTPAQVINRVKFLDERTLQIVSEDGVEKLIDIDDNFNELSYNIRPLFNEIGGEEHLSSHYYVLRRKWEVYKSVERLKMKYQDYKTAFYLHGQRDITQLLSQIINVDKYSLQADLPFSIYDWSAIEQMRNGKILVEDLHEDQVNRLMFNILPGGNTILHRLCDREEQLLKIMELAHPDNDTIKLHCPFLPNVLGETPIHRCIHKSDYKSIDIILKYLRLYHLDHHSRGISDLFPTFIKQDLPGFLEYIDDRILQTDQAKAIKRGCLKEDYPDILTVDLWFNQEQLFNKILMKKPVENRIKCSLIDMPGIYHVNSPHFGEFFEQLAETQNPEYFDKKVIKKLIELNYPIIKDALFKKLLLPFCVFLAIYQFYIFEINEHREKPLYKILNYPFLGLIIIFATYFLSNELKQLSQKGAEYFTDVWNYIDFLPPVGIYAISILIIIDSFDITIDASIQRTLVSIITFFMWFKLLYFLRIFRETGYLIGMILEVVKDMRFFFVVLLVTIFAFGSSFLAISLGNTAENQFTTSSVDATIFTYRMILGDFDTSAFGEVAAPMVWILFLLCTLFNMIVMLNLLISIISETFARVTGLADQKIYQEMAALIAENSYLASDANKKNYAEENKYLLIVEDLEAVDANADKDVFERIKELEKQVEKTMKNDKKDILEKITEAMTEIKAIKAKVQA